MKLSEATIIGGFECAFDRRSLHIYKSVTKIQAYFMRKKDWKTLCSEHREFAVRIKRSFLIKMNNVVLPRVKE